MSQENVELIRSIYAEWERGDFSSGEWADHDIECVIADGPTPGRWRGQTQMADAWREFIVAWEDWRVKADEYRDLGSEGVLVLESRSARARISGIEVGHTAGQTLSEGASP